jgi:hypothetical protein
MTISRPPAARSSVSCVIALVIAVALGGAKSTTTAATARTRVPPIAAAQRTPLSDLVERAGAYVLAFEQRFSALVAEEHYLQQLKTAARDVKGGPAFDTRELAGSLSSGGGTIDEVAGAHLGKTRREMVSDVLLVQLPDKTWFGFRDVIEVDGRRVRDREGRLQELFVKARSTTKQIVDESARYNIGPVDRNANLPTFALLCLAPDVRYRFVFEKTAEEDIDGTLTWVVSFSEVVHPTIAKDHHGKDVPSSGRFWIVPATAVVLRTEMTVGNEATDARSRTIVQYRLDAALGVPVPAIMKEIYDLPGSPRDPYVECTATYSKFRRFQVTTEEKITIPK